MIEVIPAIDLIEGKVVRLTKGDFAQSKIYSEDPLELAKRFQDIGIERLHLVDLEGAKAGKISNLKVLELLANSTKLRIDFGGGVKSENDIESIFSAGADMLTLGSVAVKNPKLVDQTIVKYGSNKLILAGDARDGKIAAHGWLETTDISILDFIENWIDAGVINFMCTDINQDGTLQGPSYELYKDILAHSPDCYLIASGGVSSVSDIYQLQEIGVPSVVVGKAIYEGMISFAELEKFCAN